MIGIVDYGMGNLFSVSEALKRLEVAFFISEDPDELAKADRLILPGVGAFKDAMVRLNDTGMTDFLHEYVATGKPLLGICLGMQLLFEESEEGGHSKGLGLLPGHVVRFPGKVESGETYKVPHMGWNRVKWVHASPITKKTDEDYAYFVHSYFVKTDNPEILIGKADYYEEVPAVVGRNSIYGMQFHPEKSSKLGVQLLTNFCNM
ncbi:imidazole glycerol phosphate synthase subunit HisH [Niallia sp. XMNu-256]|uniref:imidazole glycerol phosphate synthase subunit HisH n=1 Tax=Niallia sp. XMNu-256 TaxID=3082444 RepID=UPI0030D1A99C